MGEPFSVDATGAFAERSLHDNEEAGFAFLDTENSNLYLKNSSGFADWSAPIAFGKGEKGDTGDVGPEGPAGESFSIDQFGTFAERSNFDNEPQGFTFFDTENENLYFRQSATVGDWSDATPFGKGEKGDTGDAGPQGIQGPEGPQGLQGEPGADAPPRTLIQVYDSSGGTDVNVSTPVAIPFNAESFKDAGFTHSNSTNNSRIVLENVGRYSVFTTFLMRMVAAKDLWSSVVPEKMAALS
jgi:hypothetical protein